MLTIKHSARNSQLLNRRLKTRKARKQPNKMTIKTNWTRTTLLIVGGYSIPSRETNSKTNSCRNTPMQISDSKENLELIADIIKRVAKMIGTYTNWKLPSKIKFTEINGIGRMLRVPSYTLAAIKATIDRGIKCLIVNRQHFLKSESALTSRSLVSSTETRLFK